MRMFSKNNVRKITAVSEKALDRRQSDYSAARLESGSRMLNAEPRSGLDKVLLDSNAISSPLLRLPPELRNAIYTYALGGYVIDICCAPSQRKHVALQLLETCRQIYTEARMIPFTSNTFFHRVGSTTKPWSLSLLTQVQAISTVSLHAYRGTPGVREQEEKGVDDLVLEPFTGLRRLELLFFDYRVSPGSLALEVKERYPEVIVVYKLWNGTRWVAPSWRP